MKVLILAGGYGTRLQRDLDSEQGQQYRAQLQGLPKALVPVHGMPLISHWVEVLSPHIAKKDIYVVSNDRFYSALCDWAKGVDIPVDNIANDGTKDNAGRLGAVADIAFGLKWMRVLNAPPAYRNVPDDVMIIAGDTLFLDDFSVKEYIDAFLKLEESSKKVLVSSINMGDALDTTKSGIIELGEKTGNVASVNAFMEKPNPTETTSRESCPCFYILGKDTLILVHRFLNAHMKSPLEDKDATGKYIAWLVNQYPNEEDKTFESKVFAFPLKGRIDVGGLQTWKEAQQQKVMMP